MPRKTIRLACDNCDRADKDGITARQLGDCVAEGWEGIEPVQSHAQAGETYVDPAEAPPDFDVTAWYTHLGRCPHFRKIIEWSDQSFHP